MVENSPRGKFEPEILSWRGTGQSSNERPQPEEGDSSAGVALDSAPTSEPNRWLLNLNLSYEDMLRSTVDWLWETNAQMTFTHVSPLRGNMRVPATMQIGTNLNSLQAVAQERPARPSMRDVLEARQAFRDARFVFGGPDGSGSAFRLTGVPFYDRRNGLFLGYRGTGTALLDADPLDVSQGEADRRLVTLLDQALARKDQLEWELSKAGHRTFEARLESIAHELRTPLNAIIGFAEIIKTRALGDDLERYAGYGNDIYESGVHMVALVNNLVDLARIDSSHEHLQSELLDIREIISGAFRMLDDHANEKGVKLVDHLPEDLPHVECERQALRQIFLNLLSNGIKYTRPGGAVGVEAEETSGGIITIVVWDTGVGIPIEEQEKIFQRTYRVPGVANAGKPGSGLGLSISRDLARAMGGDIVVQSKSGHGARFSVHLPASGNKAGG